MARRTPQSGPGVCVNIDAAPVMLFDSRTWFSRSCVCDSLIHCNLFQNNPSSGYCPPPLPPSHYLSASPSRMTVFSLWEQRPCGLLTRSQPRLMAANLRQIRRLECARERSDMNASGSINPAIDRFAFRLVCLCIGICTANMFKILKSAMVL